LAENHLSAGMAFSLVTINQPTPFPCAGIF
jgi:hypothetical protein